LLSLVRIVGRLPTWRAVANACFVSSKLLPGTWMVKVGMAFSRRREAVATT
jgi:hypothetical protein